MPKYGLFRPFLFIFALIYSKLYQYPASECKNQDYGTRHKIVLKRKPSQETKETRDGSPSPNRGKGQFSKRRRQGTVLCLRIEERDDSRREGDRGRFSVSESRKEETENRPLSPNHGRKRRRTVPCLLLSPLWRRRTVPCLFEDQSGS